MAPTVKPTVYMCFFGQTYSTERSHRGNINTSLFNRLICGQNEEPSKTQYHEQRCLLNMNSSPCNEV